MKIAIEPNLTPVKDYLKSKGYQVDSVSFNKQSSGKWGGYDAFVVTGQDVNFLGIHDTVSKAAVINAEGMTPEEVAKELERINQPPYAPRVQ